MSTADQNRPSRTAKGTTLCRAMACLEQDRIGPGRDDTAKYFLSPTLVWLMRFDFIRRGIKKRILTPGVYEYVVARTQHMDQLFLDALENKYSQIVNFGAGYDSRAYRFRRKIDSTRIFEVDASGCQKHKQACMQRAQLDWPAQAAFVCIDLAQQDVASLLAEAGYDATLKTLFILEGLVMYLPEAQVVHLLSYMRDNSAKGSTIAFDYVLQSVADGTSTVYGAREQYEAVRKAGEPFTFGMEYDQMHSLLTEQGLNIEAHYTPEEFERKYLDHNQGTIFSKMYRSTYNVVVRN